MFVGVHDRLLDDKGRLALPATLRSDLGDRCYVSIDEQGCLSIRTIEDFERHGNEFLERIRRGEATKAQLRTWSTNSHQVAIDKQGRITLDAAFLQYARLEPGGAVKVAGLIDTIEIWNADRYERIEVEDHQEHPVRDWGDA